MHNTVVISELKNTDLHALSSFEALVDMMALHDIKSLRRYTEWTLSSALPLTDQENDKIFKTTYSLININKEKYTIGELPAPLEKSGGHVFRVRVQPKVLPDVSLQINAIKKKCGIQLTGLMKALIWEVRIQSQTDRENTWAVYGPKIVETRSYHQGLLANPLTETASRCL